MKKFSEFLTENRYRTLYVSRPLLNTADIRRWAGQVGLESTVPPHEMHVTVVFSKAKVTWNRFEPKTDGLLVQGGNRRIEQFGRAVVIAFDDPHLHARNAELMAKGCKSDFDQYRSHVTVTYGYVPEYRSLAPYGGPLHFGPERFQEIDENWDADLLDREVPL